MASNHPHPSQSPPTKRTRVVGVSTNNDDWFETAWSHFHAFMDDDNDDSTTKNWKALEEVIALAEPHVNVRLSNLLPIGQLTTRERLIPVLVSVASQLLAQQAMTAPPVGDNHPEPSVVLSSRSNVPQHLKRAVTLFAQNAAAWALGAEFLASSSSNGPKTGKSRTIVAVTAAWSEHACRLVQKVKMEANLVLEQDESLRLAGRVLLELLLMNQVVGVELNEQEEEEDEEEYFDEDEEEEEDLWTASTVESKARYLAALMRSAMGDHDQALLHLQQFGPSLTHRLHPNVWTMAATKGNDMASRQQPSVTAATATTAAPTITVQNGNSSTVAWEPMVVSKNPGVIPSELHQRLCQLFASPNAAYWTERPEQRRGHFSFFVPLPPQPPHEPTNVVEQAIGQYILPLVQDRLASQSPTGNRIQQEPICGFDWWIDHPPVAGRRLDFHKVLLPAEQTVAIPVVSAILFLHDGGDKYGSNEDNDKNISDSIAAAVVLDQTPDSQALGTMAWKCPAVENTLLLFAGNLLHGIIPQSIDATSSSTTSEATTSRTKKSVKPDVQDLFQKSDQALPCLTTVHVGFWTRPITGQEEAYTPCGPLPIATDSTNTWVKQMSVIDTATTTISNIKQGVVPAIGTVTCDTVPRISPAWQEIATPAKARKPPLEVLPRLDQRFFLHFEPGCFEDFLFGDNDADGEEESCQRGGDDDDEAG